MNRRNAMFLYSLAFGGSMPSFHDPLNKGFWVTIGYKGGLYVLILSGCATRLGRDLGGFVIKAFCHTNLDVLMMMRVKSYTLINVGFFSALGCQHVVVDVLVDQRIKKRNIVVVFHIHGEMDGLLL